MVRPPTIDPSNKAALRASKADPRAARTRRRERRDRFEFYRLLCGYPVLSSYRAKFAAIVIAGIGLPTFLLMLVIVLGAARLSALALLVLLIVSAAASIVGILWAVERLLRPLELAARALDALADDVDLPRMELPGTDEAAQILRGVQSVIGRLRLQEEHTRRASDLDELTGLYQRRAGRARAQALLEAETRRGRTMRVVLADVDGMRRFNERFGAGHGDALLKALGTRLAQIAGHDGIAVRWSGDRFLLVQGVAPDAEGQLEELLGRPVVIKGSDDPVRLSWSEARTETPVALDGLIAQAEANLDADNAGR